MAIEWGSVVQWFTAVSDFLVKVAGLALQGVWIYVLWNLLRPMLAAMSGRSGSSFEGMANPKLMLRRLFCKHRHLAYGRARWGKVTTLCASCGKDVNEGKPREEWR